MKQVGMIGEGAWGTAVATLLAHNGYTVHMWCHDPQVAQTIKKKRMNERYLPGVTLSEKIIPVTNVKDAIQDIPWVFEAIPVKFLRNTLETARQYVHRSQFWVVLSKGIEQHTLQLPTDIINDVFGPTETVVFAGPSFAREVATQQITAVTLAAKDCSLSGQLQELLANKYFRPYISTDMIGVQLSAALKNVITLGVGMLKGAGYSDNAQAFLFTRGLHEIAELVVARGGKRETVYGFAGVGDLVLTAFGTLSRNLEVGKRLGAGESLKNILDKTGYIPEGINTVQSIFQMIQKEELSLPICQGIYEVIFGDTSLQSMLAQLMAQPLEWECTS